MRFSLRMLLIGIMCIPVGVAIAAMGFIKDGGVPIFPAGKFLGPLALVLGIVLIVMTVRSLKHGD